VTGLDVRALTFDVFGTVVDWRSGIAREVAAMAARRGLELDAVAFADAWRGLYQPSMSDVREGRRPWVRLDVLHRESLVRLLDEFGVEGLGEAEIVDLNRAWHRLDPWPDCVEGLRRLHTRYILVTLSNGNVALMVNMARHAGLPWDTILGAETTRHYKPQAQTYLGTAEALDLAPEQCMMVAAHNTDLVMARSLGFRTAFVARPTEYGPEQSTDQRAEHDFDVVATSMVGVAEALGC
jgi:2-haloacid dehalogenase